MSGCPFEMGSSSLMRGTCGAMLAHACVVVVVRRVRRDRGQGFLDATDVNVRETTWGD